MTPSTCRTCNNPLTQGASFCQSCGQPVPSEAEETWISPLSGIGRLLSLPAEQNTVAALPPPIETVIVSPAEPTGSTLGGNRAPWRPDSNRGLFIGLGVAVVIGGIVVALTLAGRHRSQQTTNTFAASPTGNVAASTYSPANSASANTTQVTAADSGQTQAKNLEDILAGLLSQSGHARASLRNAVSGVSDCSQDPNAAAAVADSAAHTRQSILDRLQNFDASALPNGAQLVSQLQGAMSASADADRAFASWMRWVAATSCSGTAGHDSNFASAGDSSTRATAAKQAFVTLWNPVAAHFGYPQLTELEL